MAMKLDWTKIKQLFCNHVWVDSCKCGLKFTSLCNYRNNVGSCFLSNKNHTFICSDKIMECSVCGKRRYPYE